MAWLIPDNLRRRKDIPAPVKQCAEAFATAMGKSVTVWYEPPFDPAGERPDFIVLDPRRGIAVFSVVARPKEDILGMFRGTLRIHAGGAESEFPNPVLKADALTGLLEQRIRAESRLRHVECPVTCGLLLPTLTAAEAAARNFASAIPLDRLATHELVSHAVNRGDEQFTAWFQHLFGASSIPELQQESLDILRGIIQPEIVIDRIGSSQSAQEVMVFREPAGGEDIVRVMDRRQETLAKSLGAGHRVIRGVAGSGKTLILVYRAKLLGRLFPGKRFLVTCYTRSLAAQLRVLLAARSNVEVVHLDRLMWGIMKGADRYPEQASRDNSEAVAAFVLELIAKGHGRKYDAVLLDEAQDFGTNCLRVVSALAASKDADLLVVADAAQNIFNRRSSWKDAEIRAQGRTTILNENYRNTREILAFASAFLLHGSAPRGKRESLEEDEIIEPKAALRSGAPPTVIFASNYAAGISRTVEAATAFAACDDRPRAIAVSYMVRTIDSYRLADDLYDGLVKAGLDVFRLTDPDAPDARDRLFSVNANVILSTVHSLKGLEFPYVVMSGLLHPMMEHASNKKLAYVGMTRATTELTVVSARSNPMVEALQAGLQALEQLR